MRKSIIAGNWKMNKTIEEGIGFVKELAPLVEHADCSVYLAVPFTAIRPISEAIQQTNLILGAQNMNDASEGAFTGEIAAKMLTEAGAKFVILGHSERRQIFHETDEMVQKKVHKALSERLQPLVCVGENKQERESGKAEEIVKKQIQESLKGVSPEQMESLIVAYEPVWAIGTGLSATAENAQQMIAFCRSCIAEFWSPETANQVTIQYGGSVHAQNAKQFIQQPDIDGLLVGGASLEVKSFSQIVNQGKKE